MTKERLNKMVEEEKISGVYALDTCFVKVHADGTEDYLKFGNSTWGTAGWNLSEKDQYMIDCGLGIEELDEEMTKKMNNIADNLMAVRHFGGFSISTKDCETLEFEDGGVEQEYTIEEFVAHLKKYPKIFEEFKGDLGLDEKEEVEAMLDDMAEMLVTGENNFAQMSNYLLYVVDDCGIVKEI